MIYYYNYIFTSIFNLVFKNTNSVICFFYNLDKSLLFLKFKINNGFYYIFFYKKIYNIFVTKPIYVCIIYIKNNYFYLFINKMFFYINKHLSYNETFITYNSKPDISKGYCSYIINSFNFLNIKDIYFKNKTFYSLLHF